MGKKRYGFKTEYKLKAIAPTVTNFKSERTKQITIINECYPAHQEAINTLKASKQASINGVCYATLQEAINSICSTEETLITLHSDVYLFNRNIYICQNLNVVLDLAGHVISSYNGDGTIYLEGSLTVLDSSISCSGLIENTYSNGIGIYFYKSGTLNLFGGTVKAFCSLYSWNEFFSPDVTIDGGTLEGESFGVSIRNIENLRIIRGIIRGNILSFNTLE